MITAQNTRILVTVQIVDDTRSIMFLLALATGLFEFLHRSMVALQDEIDLWAEAVSLAGKVISITGRSLAFGLGVSI